MKFQLDINIPPLVPSIRYTDKMLLCGSCFTEHMADRLAQHGFDILSNPHGILFNPLSVASSLKGYLENKRYQADELFHLNELWNSWDHHTRFSDIDKDVCLQSINDAQQEATARINTADWVIITLGSAFQYYLKENDAPVANNHRAPGQWFDKRLLGIAEIVQTLSETLHLLQQKNPGAKVIFTVSPVRHIRDGVVDNNRSKARLIEAVHELCCAFSFATYFPAYEIVMDVLRDYRFFDVDMVHPNYAATSYVWELFSKAAFSEETAVLMKEILELNIAKNHRPRFAETQSHKDFLAKYSGKASALQLQHPFLNLREIIEYFRAI